jgi:hypothetical protein
VWRDWSRVSPVINDPEGIRARSESQGVPVLYLPHRFRESLEHLEFQNYRKFLQNGRA